MNANINKKTRRLPGFVFRTHGSGQIPHPNPELPQDEALDVTEVLPAELNADINFSVFLLPHSGQIMLPASGFDVKTNSSKICTQFLHLNSNIGIPNILPKYFIHY